MSSKEQWGKAVAGARASNPAARKGAMIMKTVTLLLASSRRALNQAKEPNNNNKQSGGAGGGSNKVAVQTPQSAADRLAIKRKLRAKKMEEASGKLNPKLLDMFKKKTHFSK